MPPNPSPKSSSCPSCTAIKTPADSPKAWAPSVSCYRERHLAQLRAHRFTHQQSHPHPHPHPPPRPGPGPGPGPGPDPSPTGYMLPPGLRNLSLAYRYDSSMRSFTSRVPMGSETRMSACSGRLQHSTLDWITSITPATAVGKSKRGKLVRHCSSVPHVRRMRAKPWRRAYQQQLQPYPHSDGTRRPRVENAKVRNRRCGMAASHNAPRDSPAQRRSCAACNTFAAGTRPLLTLGPTALMQSACLARPSISVNL